MFIHLLHYIWIRNVFVQAYDLGERPLSSEVLVVVYVVDQNDHAPQFDRALYRKAIPEDTPPGTSVTQVRPAPVSGCVLCARMRAFVYENKSNRIGFALFSLFKLGSDKKALPIINRKWESPPCQRFLVLGIRHV